MNRTNIEWVVNPDGSKGRTWNPITGCSRRCPYCYAMRMAQRLKGRYGYPRVNPFKPTFHPDRLKEPFELKKPTRIFVCSMGEIFDPRVSDEWISQIWDTIEANPQHTFILLTQCIDRPSYYDFSFPTNCWLGVTVTKEKHKSRIRQLASCAEPKIKFVSFEPLLEEITPNLTGIDWIIIGSKTGSHPFQPQQRWVVKLINSARRYGCKVFLKNNLRWPCKIQEYPEVKK